MREGNLYFKDSADKPAEISDYSGKKRNRVIGMIGIRDAARAVVQAQTENCSDDELHKLQAVATLHGQAAHTAELSICNSAINIAAIFMHYHILHNM